MRQLFVLTSGFIVSSHSLRIACRRAVVSETYSFDGWESPQTRIYILSFFWTTGKCDKLSRTGRMILPLADVEAIRAAVEHQACSTREALSWQHQLSTHLRAHMREVEENLSGITMALQRSVLQELHLRHQLQLLQG